MNNEQLKIILVVMFSVDFIVVLIHNILPSSKLTKPTSVTIIFSGQNACGAKWTYAWECGISWFVVVYTKLLKMWLLFSVNFCHHGKKP